MTSQAESPPEGLAQQLKAATAAMHRRVERSSFMVQMLRGSLNRRQYVNLLRNLRALYGALETALLKNAAHPAVAAVLMPELFRSSAIDADLRSLQTTADTGAEPLQQATQDYVARLQALQTAQPSLLVAHAYVRYLGDLNGGQALQRVVLRSLQLDNQGGTAFYDFGTAATCQALIQRFRTGLAAIVVPVSELNDIVAEAVSAFERHGQLFQELSTEA